MSKNKRSKFSGKLGFVLSAEIADQIFDDPSSDDRVVWNDQNRDNGVDPAPGGKPFRFAERLESADRAFSCHASDGGLGNDHGVAEGKSQDDVDQ